MPVVSSCGHLYLGPYGALRIPDWMNFLTYLTSVNFKDMGSFILFSAEISVDG
jgi:hypothetical protein